jgi:hypothetical protein
MRFRLIIETSMVLFDCCLLVWIIAANNRDQNCLG